MFKSGFVAIVGKPNAGKSTLINQIFKNKISIATPKQNTTRNRINAIYNEEDLQICFVDTPGFLSVRNKLDEQMVKVIRDSIQEVDIVLFIIKSNEDLDQEYLKNIDLTNVKAKKFLLINKIDKLKSKNEIFSIIEKYDELKLFDEIIPISALKDINVDKLIKVIKENLQEDISYFPTDKQTLYSDEFYTSEIIREKILFLLEQEIPHEIFVSITDFIQKKDLLKIRAEIIISRKSLKKILIGQDGTMIKNIGEKSRFELEKYFKKKIYLELFIKVRENWKNKDSIIKTHYS